MTKFAVPVFKRQGGGVIVNTGFEAGSGMIFNSAYAAAKEGIAGLTRSVAREQGRFGIRCNMIRPRATVNTGGGAWGQEVFAKWLPMAKAWGLPDWRSWLGRIHSPSPSRTGCGVSRVALYGRRDQCERALFLCCW